MGRTVQQEWLAFKKELKPGDEKLIRLIFFSGFLGGLARGLNPDATTLEFAQLHDECARELGFGKPDLTPLVHAQEGTQDGEEA